MALLRLSLLAIACQSVLFPVYAHAQTPISQPKAGTQASTDKANTSSPTDYERITVYGRQNHVVMNSGLATKSNMSLMEPPRLLLLMRH
jgi:hypothetical protein